MVRSNLPGESRLPARRTCKVCRRVPASGQRVLGVPVATNRGLPVPLPATPMPDPQKKSETDQSLGDHGGLERGSLRRCRRRAHGRRRLSLGRAQSVIFSDRRKALFVGRRGPPATGPTAAAVLRQRRLSRRAPPCRSPRDRSAPAPPGRPAPAGSGARCAAGACPRRRGRATPGCWRRRFPGGFR